MGRYGASVLVGVGWFATVVAAFAVGEWSVPQRPVEPADCTSFGCGLTLLDLLPAFLVLVGGPALLLLLAVTAGVHRLRLPAALTGTLSALGTVAVAAAGIALYTAAR